MADIEITQADRDVADPFMGRMDGWYLGKERYEDLLVQAFARHRTEAIAPYVERERVLVEAIRPILRFHQTGGHEGDGSDEALERALAALAKIEARPETPAAALSRPMPEEAVERAHDHRAAEAAEPS